MRMKTWPDPLIVEYGKLDSADLLSLHQQLVWHNLMCLSAPQGSYEDRIESEPTANELTDVEYEICRRVIEGSEDGLLKHAVKDGIVDREFWDYCHSERKN